jgi:ankyrin repeat protein
MTALHTACQEGKFDRIKEYIKLGADINSADNAQWTPLHEASLNGHVGCIKILLNHGAKVFFRKLIFRWIVLVNAAILH